MAGEGSRCARPETRANLFSIATFIFHRFYATGWEADFGLVMWRATNLSFTLVMAVVPQGSSTIASCRSRRLDSPASCKGTSANWLWLRAVRRPSFGTLRKICLGTVEPQRSTRILFLGLSSLGHILIWVRRGASFTVYTVSA